MVWYDIQNILFSDTFPLKKKSYTGLEQEGEKMTAKYIFRVN